MLTKKHLPSLGFILLLIVLVSSSLFVKWVIGPLSYEKAITLEKDGHKYFKEKKYNKAFYNFLQSAKFDDNNKTKSYRYRCAGTALNEQKKYKESLQYYEKALKYNKNNKQAKDAISWIYSTGKVKKISTTKEVLFLAGGHLYGSPRWHGTLYPAPSIIENVNNFNKMNLDFFIGLGDIVNGPTQKRLEIINRSFIKKLNIPFYNAVGNHDFANHYKNFFKIDKYYSSFEREGNLFIILDTETIKGEIKSTQLEFLKNKLNHANNNLKIQNIFIFSHKLLWAYGLKNKYSTVYNHINAKTGYQENSNFKNTIFPSLLKSKKHIYWISGDIGVDWTLPAFYDEYNEKLTFIAIGLGDTKDDMLLKVKINNINKVNFDLISLIDFGNKIDLKKYNLAYWSKYFHSLPKGISIKYINRFKDGWSKGKSASVLIKNDKASIYNLLFYTNNREKNPFLIKIFINNKIYKKINIKSRKKYKILLKLPSGNHEINISINKTFNPKKLGLSKDNRDLGVHFEIKKEGDK